MADFFDTDREIPVSEPISPGARLDFFQDWSEWLNGDSVSSVTWSVPAGLTVSSQSEDDGVFTVWLSGFVASRAYDVTCTVETATVPSRKDARTMRIVCRKHGRTG